MGIAVGKEFVKRNWTVSIFLVSRSVELPGSEKKDLSLGQAEQMLKDGTGGRRRCQNKFRAILGTKPAVRKTVFLTRSKKAWDGTVKTWIGK
jgi:hypothetical protein